MVAACKRRWNSVICCLLLAPFRQYLKAIDPPAAIQTVAVFSIRTKALGIALRFLHASNQSDPVTQIALIFGRVFQSFQPFSFRDA